MTNPDFYQYRIYRSTTGQSNSFSLIGTSINSSFQDTGLAPNITYYYYITQVSRYLTDLGTFTFTESSPSAIFSLYNNTQNNQFTVFGMDALTYNTKINNVQIVGEFTSPRYNSNFVSSTPEADYIIPGILNRNFKFSKEAGIIPNNLILETYNSYQAKISGIPILPELPKPITESNYPVLLPTIDRYYFVLKATSLENNSLYGEYLYYLNIRKNWSDIRDQFILGINNQSFTINNKIVTNKEYLDYQKLIGNY